jgi:small basic protein
MSIAIFGILLGLLVGYYIPLNLSGAASIYLSVAILAAVDSLLGGIRANLEGRFDALVFISGFFFNSLLAFLLAYLGDQLGVPLYYTALFVFGTRLFNNLGYIRRHLIKRL